MRAKRERGRRDEMREYVGARVRVHVGMTMRESHRSVCGCEESVTRRGHRGTRGCSHSGWKAVHFRVRHG